MEKEVSVVPTCDLSVNLFFHTIKVASIYDYLQNIFHVPMTPGRCSHSLRYKHCPPVPFPPLTFSWVCQGLSQKGRVNMEKEGQQFRVISGRSTQPFTTAAGVSIFLLFIEADNALCFDSVL